MKKGDRNFQTTPFNALPCRSWCLMNKWNDRCPFQNDFQHDFHFFLASLLLCNHSIFLDRIDKVWVAGIVLQSEMYYLSNKLWCEKKRKINRQKNKIRERVCEHSNIIVMWLESWTKERELPVSRCKRWKSLNLVGASFSRHLPWNNMNALSFCSLVEDTDQGIQACTFSTCFCRIEYKLDQNLPCERRNRTFYSSIDCD